MTNREKWVKFVCAIRSIMNSVYTDKSTVLNDRQKAIIAEIIHEYFNDISISNIEAISVLNAITGSYTAYTAIATEKTMSKEAFFSDAFSKDRAEIAEKFILDTIYVCKLLAYMKSNANSINNATNLYTLANGLGLTIGKTQELWEIAVNKYSNILHIERVNFMQSTVPNRTKSRPHYYYYPVYCDVVYWYGKLKKS